jgi:HPt (histidine-containing phosphotransfer) domain-containing protein
MAQLDLSRFQASFIEEARDLLRGLEGDLLRLERDPSDQQTLQHIFRALHALKASAGMYGFPQVSVFSAALETLMKPLGRGEGEISEDIINTALQSGDLIAEFINSDIPEGEFDRRSQQLRGELSRLLSPADTSGSSLGARIAQSGESAKLSEPGMQEHTDVSQPSAIDSPLNRITVDVPSLLALEGQIRQAAAAAAFLGSSKPKMSAEQAPELEDVLARIGEGVARLFFVPAARLFSELRWAAGSGEGGGAGAESLETRGGSVVFDVRFLRSIAAPMGAIIRALARNHSRFSGSSGGDPGQIILEAGEARESAYISIYHPAMDIHDIDDGSLDGITDLRDAIRDFGAVVERAAKKSGASLRIRLPRKSS